MKCDYKIYKEFVDDLLKPYKYTSKILGDYAWGSRGVHRGISCRVYRVEFEAPDNMLTYMRGADIYIPKKKSSRYPEISMVFSNPQVEWILFDDFLKWNSKTAYSEFQYTTKHFKIPAFRQSSRIHLPLTYLNENVLRDVWEEQLKFL